MNYLHLLAVIVVGIALFAGIVIPIFACCFGFVKTVFIDRKDNLLRDWIISILIFGFICFFCWSVFYLACENDPKSAPQAEAAQ